MSSLIKLLVQTEEQRFVDDPQGFVSTDKPKKEARLIEEICDREGIPYSKEFVSMHVKVPASPRPNLPQGRTFRSWKPIQAFGDLEIELRQEIANELSLVCVGDFKNIILNGETKGSDYIRKNIIVLPADANLDERLRILESAALEAQKQRRGGYAEARLFRALRTEDKA